MDVYDPGSTVLCNDCIWLLVLNEDVRMGLSQENKEILNILERSGYDLNDFGYCRLTGFIESLRAFKTCGNWSLSL